MTRIIDPIQAEHILDYCGGYIEVKQAMILYGKSKSCINKMFNATEELMRSRGIKKMVTRPRVVPLDMLKEILPLNESRIRKSAENQRRIQAQIQKEKTLQPDK